MKSTKTQKAHLRGAWKKALYGLAALGTASLSTVPHMAHAQTFSFLQGPDNLAPDTCLSRYNKEKLRLLIDNNGWTTAQIKSKYRKIADQYNLCSMQETLARPHVKTSTSNLPVAKPARPNYVTGAGHGDWIALPDLQPCVHFSENAKICMQGTRKIKFSARWNFF